ncbi:hypothetical protein SAY87_005807 [Trapa incisa]|uniref:Auxin-responsive protein n=1 Tax=Trapa incisa TaxID=236973 RepID=A0AAN7K6Q8_9MYRT|nr:hypothetical protein SAY87_005807 [Trapa incisa]
MSLPLLGVEGGTSDVTKVTGSFSLKESPDGLSLGLKERNYLGLSSDSSSVDSSVVSGQLDPEAQANKFNTKATELRLGLPGSQSPERELDEKPLFPLLPSKDGIKNAVSGNKRGFSDAIDSFSDEKWMFHRPDEGKQLLGQGKFPNNAAINVMTASRHSGPQQPGKEVPSKPLLERSNGINLSGGANNAPAAKAQVIGWPPVRSFRKNTLAAASKGNDEVDGKPGPSPLFVKVIMDGAPYLRKVDLRNYYKYCELSVALEKMFSGFTLGQCGANGTSGREMMSESKLKDLLHGSDYVLTYEDKDGDWMLVGDVPWEMFIETCKKLKIMKSSDAIGLAPRAMEKSKARN